MYVYVVALVAFPVLAVFVFAGPVHWWWVQRFEGPDLAKELGFRLEEREVTIDAGDRWQILVIVEVTPGGVFDRAGVKAGDVIACLHHGRGEFWGQMQLARDGYEVDFKVVPLTRLSDGCSVAHRIQLPGRSLRGSHQPQNNQMQLTSDAAQAMDAARS
jgi:C-terminal processing protease CtpA/Prc